MNIFKVYRNLLEFKRALQILLIIIKYGFREWFYRTRWGRNRIKKHPNPQKEVRTTSQRLRLAIEELGPTYIKFGQILADRPDIISDHFRNELKKLQNQAIPIDNSVAIRLIEKELGRPINELFSEFDENCLAAASIGQVYQAKFITGEEVIIKIQRPRIEEKIKVDLYLLRYLAKRFVATYPEMAAINLVGFVNEFGDKIMKELDYRNESNNILRFMEIFKNEPTVYVPKTYPQYVTKKLLIMEKIKGIPPDDIMKLRESGLDTHQIAVNGANALLKMILENGFFHADPHPGNIFILEKNVVSFIDYGMAASLRPREMNFLANFCLGFARRDTRSIANALLSLCDAKFFGERDELEFDIDEVIKKHSYVPLDEIDLAEIMQECINVLVKYKLQIPSGIFMLVKALATIQKFAGNLDPQISLTPIIVPYAKRLILQKYHPRKIASAIYDSFSDYITLLRTLPSEISEILYKLKEGKIHHEIKIQESSGLDRTMRQIAFRFASVIIVVGIFVGSSILAVFSPQDEYGRWGLILSVILLIFLLLKSISTKRKKYYN